MFPLSLTKFQKPLLWEKEFVQDLDKYNNFEARFSFKL